MTLKDERKVREGRQGKGLPSHRTGYGALARSFTLPDTADPEGAIWPGLVLEPASVKRRLTAALRFLSRSRAPQRR